MTYHCRNFAIAFLLVITLWLTTQAEAASWVGVSLELRVADADIVVRGTVETFEPIPESTEQKATFHILETLKGKAEQSIECLIPYSYGKILEGWQKDKTELLLCLVKSERSRAPSERDPRGVEWSAGQGHFGGAGIIPLSGDPLGGVPTSGFQFLTKPDEILKLAREAVQADAVTKVPRGPGGAAATVELDVPFGSRLGESLHTKSANGLITVLNEALEAKACQWIKTDNEMEKLNGVSVLSHFKSEENIAALKTLLTDPSVQGSIVGHNIITTYRVRAAALAVLKSWDVKATAVVREKTSAKDR